MEKPSSVGDGGQALSADERAALYKTLFSRRDVRSQFIDRALPTEVLTRLLYAAHHAPSVGFMQPWQFMLIQSPKQREAIYQAFLAANQEAAEQMPAEKQSQYRNLKLEGLKSAAVNLCLVCDRERVGPVVLGRTHFKDMDLYSTVCAVQNLWLAARAEGVGCGWVSILAPDQLREILQLPEHVEPIAYLCLGYVSHFEQTPDLQRAGWRERQSLSSLLYQDTWGQGFSAQHELIQEIEAQSEFPQQSALSP